MKNIFRSLLKTFLFLFLGGAMLLKIQDILTPRWMPDDHLENTVNGIDKLESDVDVFFLGASHVLSGVSPMELYQNYGICSYLLSTSGQPMPVSYFLLEKAYETHEAETVVLDVSTMFQETWEPGLRYLLDTLELGSVKIEMARDYAENEWGDGFLSAIFPLIRFHSNWSSLTEINFQPKAETHSYTFGQVMLNTVSPAGVNLELMDEAADLLSQYHGRTVEVTNGETFTEEISTPLYAPSIPETSMTYFLKIKELCDKHGSNLILIKVPVMGWPQLYSGTWTRQKSAITKELAEDYGLRFLDLLYDVDSLVSFDTDTRDGGAHLNSLGAKKVSAYLGEYLIENHLAESKSEPVYDDALKKYQKIDAVIQLQMTTDFYEYIEKLKILKEDKTILIAAADDYVNGMTADDYALLNDLGLTLIADGRLHNSYLAAISKGNTLYEGISDYELNHEMWISDLKVWMSSRNWWLENRGYSIQINNIEYAKSYQYRGLNFVVYDHEMDCVIDCVSFDTYELSKPCTRDSNQTIQLFSNYESLLCYDGR